MSFRAIFEPYDESTPLMSNCQTSRFKGIPADSNSQNRESLNDSTISTYSSSYEDQKSLLISPGNSNNQSLSTDDRNKNNEDLRNDEAGVNLQQHDVRVYKERWYILAVFSLLGVLQVNNNIFCIYYYRRL